MTRSPARRAATVNSVPLDQVPPQCRKLDEVWIANGYAVRTDRVTNDCVFFEVICEL
jgi:hypothetical protein